MAANTLKILTFTVEKQRFAIHLLSIERIIRAQAITKFNDSPGFIAGVIDYYGEIIAVINLRKKLGFTLQELKLSDRFIIVKTSDRKLVLIVDEVEDVLSPDSQDMYDSKDIEKGLKFINILRDDMGIVFIYDLENLLSNSEEIELKDFIKANFSSGDNI